MCCIAPTQPRIALKIFALVLPRPKEKMMPCSSLHLARPNGSIIIKRGANCKKNVCIFSLYFQLHIIPKHLRPRILACPKDYITLIRANQTIAHGDLNFLLSHQSSIPGRALFSREAHRIYRRVGLHLTMKDFIANDSNQEYFNFNFLRT